jgi:hypothetical protein
MQAGLRAMAHREGKVPRMRNRETTIRVSAETYSLLCKEKGRIEFLEEDHISFDEVIRRVMKKESERNGN